ncbi:MAG: DUF3572 family protein [Pseudomonadota bacterium]
MPALPFETQHFVLTAFAFLAQDDARLHGLIDLAGLEPDGLKQALAAQDSGLALHVTEYLLSDERWARDYCQQHDLSAEQLALLAQAAGHERLMQS